MREVHKAVIDKILGLDDGVHRFHYEMLAQEIGLDSRDFEGRDHFEKPISTDVVLTKTNHLYYTKLSIAAEARFLCDRCLEEVPELIESSFEIVFTDKRDAREQGTSDAELRTVDIRKENRIVLDDDIRASLELVLPSKNLCRESCKGLCVRCGINLNEKMCEHERAKQEN